MSAPDYEAVIRDLKDERAKIDAAIEALSELSARRSGREQLPLPVATQAGRSIVWPYKDMSVARAAEEHLRTAARPMTASAIATALKEGGIETRAENFTPIVYNALNGNKKTFHRERRGQDAYWHLTAWGESKVA